MGEGEEEGGWKSVEGDVRRSQAKEAAANRQGVILVLIVVVVVARGAGDARRGAKDGYPCLRRDPLGEGRQLGGHAGGDLDSESPNSKLGSNLAAAFQALFPTLKAPPTLPVQAHFTPQQYEAVTMAMGPLKRLRKVKFPLLHKPRPSSDSPTLQELQALERAPDADIDLRPQLNDIRMWRAVIRGPGETPFEGGTFQLLIEVGPEYPIRPPLIRFITRVFHPNIHFETGEICLDILKKEWSPAWSLQAACRAVMALLAAPDADSPLNCDAGNMVRAGDMRAFHSMARMYTAEYASVA